MHCSYDQITYKVTDCCRGHLSIYIVTNPLNVHQTPEFFQKNHIYNYLQVCSMDGVYE